MHRSAFVVVLAAVVSTASLRAQEATATQRALYRLENQWAEAVVKRDAAAIRRSIRARSASSSRRSASGRPPRASSSGSGRSAPSDPWPAGSPIGSDGGA